MDLDSVHIRPATPDEIDVAIAVDDDACALHAQAGLHLDLGPEHPFARAERARWTRAAHAGHAFLAEEPGGRAIGLVVLGRNDGAPYLDQLSVRTSAMRGGLATDAGF